MIAQFTALQYVTLVTYRVCFFLSLGLSSPPCANFKTNVSLHVCCRMSDKLKVVPFMCLEMPLLPRLNKLFKSHLRQLDNAFENRALSAKKYNWEKN